MTFLYKKLLYKSSLLSDIVISLLIILTGYFYYYENRKIIYNIENYLVINYIIKICLAITIILVWFILCIQNGAKKRYSFLIYTLCIWVIPQISKYFIDKIDFSIYTETFTVSFLLFIKYISNINYLSLKLFGDLITNKFDISYPVTLNCLIICFIIVFVIGIILHRYCNNTGD